VEEVEGRRPTGCGIEAPRKAAIELLETDGHGLGEELQELVNVDQHEPVGTSPNRSTSGLERELAVHLIESEHLEAHDRPGRAAGAVQGGGEDGRGERWGGGGVDVGVGDGEGCAVAVASDRRTDAAAVRVELLEEPL